MSPIATSDATSTMEASSAPTKGLLHFEHVAPSKQQDLPFADLKTVDMGSFNDGPEAQAKIAEEIRQAMHEQGFFTLINHGFTQEEVARQMDIGYTVLQRTPLSEKQRLRARMQEDGCYKGFKLRQYYEMENGVKDKIEQFNWFRDMKSQEFPSTIQPYLDEVKEFSARMHNDVFLNLMRPLETRGHADGLLVFAISLQLPSETLVERHQFGKHDESWLRYMAYYDEHTKEDESKVKGVWLKGHQDFGTLTLLFSQPMCSLQVRDEQGKWAFVRHTPGAIIVNCGVFMEWYTGGYFKAANHRVAAPPDDQRNHTRMGVFYFAPNTLMESPVLQQAGVTPTFESPEKSVTSKVYSQARIANVGKSELYKRQWGDGERVVEVLAGVEVPWYG
ncbi:hypothetical protein EHS25_007097 [Saitozyma podzolica]|uniref:Fe2OG dioxygenase domain-containing protein n=1 Tax=Saitozyma podzolica TaxID=1890683 RepID=A0A427XPK7_9TREE|nr:hypothetical protein EHS25_007097 [Saitozyma podzolica]